MNSINSINYVCITFMLPYILIIMAVSRKVVMLSLLFSLICLNVCGKENVETSPYCFHICESVYAKCAENCKDQFHVYKCIIKYYKCKMKLCEPFTKIPTVQHHVKQEVKDRKYIDF